MAVLAPALYIGYLASTTGQSAVSISRVRTDVWDLVTVKYLQRYLRSLIDGTDPLHDIGNLDMTRRSLQSDLTSLLSLIQAAYHKYQEL